MAAFENSLQSLKKLSIELPMILQSHSYLYIQENENTHLPKNSNMNVHSSTIPSSQQVETTHSPSNEDG